MSSSRLLVNTVIRRSYSTAPASTASIEDLLLKLAIPLVRESGWTTATLSRASLLLPHPHTPTTSYSIATLQGLFPSPPAKPRPHSLTREELLRDARGEFDGKEAEDRERCGPGQALFEAWLKEGRSATIRAMKSDSGVKGHEAVRRGLKSRISFNHTMGILDDLPEGLALLSASTSIAPIPTLSLPSPTPYLEHVASIAHDITQASGSEAQGTDWYLARGKVGSIYALAELHLISPNLSTLSPADRVASTNALVDRMLDSTTEYANKLGDAKLFMTFVTRSWAGLFRSVGF